MPPVATYTLPEFAKLSGVTPRTIRYYISEGLLPSPGAGPQARYTDEHLDRVRLIRELQRNHLPLAEIRTQLHRVSHDEVRNLLHSRRRPAQSGTSALDYIRSVLGGASPRPAPPAGPVPAPASVREHEPRAYLASAGAPPASFTEPPTTQLQPDRSHWERVALDPDIELHIRRPLTRRQNRAVSRIIGAAREILEEDQP